MFISKGRAFKISLVDMHRIYQENLLGLLKRSQRSVIIRDSKIIISSLGGTRMYKMYYALSRVANDPVNVCKWADREAHITSDKRLRAVNMESVM